VVIYELNGKMVMRSMPAKKRGKSKGRQKETQELFKQVMKPMQIAKAYLRYTFAGHKGYSPYHSALAINMKQISEAGAFSYQQLLFSTGKLAGVTQTALYIKEHRIVEVSWQTNEAEKPASAQDISMLLAFNVTRQQVEFNTFAGRRHDGKAILLLNEAQTGDQLEIYLSLLALEKGKTIERFMISDSQWLGSMVL